VDAQTPKEQDTSRSATSSWALVALIMAMTALGPLTLNILVPAIPNLVVTMNTDPGTVQLTISLYLFGLAVSQLALGPLSDRFGRRPVVIAGLLITAAASILALAATSIGGLIAARTLQALGASTGLVIGRAIIRDLYDRDRAASMIGWVMTVMVVAPMVAPALGGLLDTTFGWQAIFLFVAVASVLVLIWAVLALRETRPDHVTSGGFRFIAGEARALLRQPVFNGYMLVCALGTATFFAFLGGAPHLIIGIMGRSSAEYGAWFALSGLGYMVGNLMAARLSPRVGIDPMIRAGIWVEIAGTLLGIVLAVLFPFGGPETVMPPQFLISCGNGMLLPNAVAGAISVRPQSAGTASGIVGFVQMGMGALSAQAMSHVIEHSATAQPLAWVMFVLAGLAMVAFVTLVRPAQKS
jgi:DHA1 family bicyclomycin/chloramphenicol resistance-like MFS transporter